MVNNEMAAIENKPTRSAKKRFILTRFGRLNVTRVSLQVAFKALETRLANDYQRVELPDAT
jgi:hypothetical protein